MTIDELRELARSLPQPGPVPEIRLAEATVPLLRAAFPATQLEPELPFVGIPIFEDPTIPEGFIVLLGEELPYDHDDPYSWKGRRAIHVIDLRPGASS